MAPERHPLPNCKQTSLLTKSSWDSGWSTSAGRVTARDQLPRRDTQHTWEGEPVVHPENRAAETGEVIRRSLQLGATVLGPGTGTNCRPSQVCAFVDAREPEPVRRRPGRRMQTRAPIRRFPAEQPGAWAEQTGKAHTPWAGANPVRLDHCGRSPHTPVRFVCSVHPSPQHDWTSEP